MSELPEVTPDHIPGLLSTKEIVEAMRLLPSGAAVTFVTRDVPVNTELLHDILADESESSGQQSTRGYRVENPKLGIVTLYHNCDPVVES